MSRAMKLVFAYDGSECADDALAGLQHAGIPDGSEVVVVTVSEWFPIPVDVGDLPLDRPQGDAAEAVRFAEFAQHRLQELHPAWTVRAESFFGSPAREIVRFAEEWGAELIVTGSHGRSAIGRFFLGSVSHQILSSAGCSVRIARNGYTDSSASAPTIVLALDGSEYSNSIVEAVLHRSWPERTAFVIVSAAEYAYDNDEEREMMGRLHSLHEEIGRKLGARGFTTQSVIDTRMMHPRTVILAEAERAGAECIFVGARGLTGFERVMLGSVSTAVALRARCSVEVIHHPRR